VLLTLSDDAISVPLVEKKLLGNLRVWIMWFFHKGCNLKPFVGLCYRFNNLSYLYKMHE
jgi:hypothetical protein